MIEYTESSTNHSRERIQLTEATHEKSAKEFDTESAK